MRRVFFYAKAVAALDRLDKAAAAKILEKIGWLADHPNPESVTAKLENVPEALVGLTRLRVGDYRVLLWLEADAVAVYAVGHRARVYDILKKR